MNLDGVIEEFKKGFKKKEKWLDNHEYLMNISEYFEFQNEID